MTTATTVRPVPIDPATARLNRITPKRLAKHMKRHPDAPITQAIGALL